MGIGRRGYTNPKYHMARGFATCVRRKPDADRTLGPVRVFGTSLRRVLLQLLLDVHLRDGADDLVDDLAILEEQQHRN